MSPNELEQALAGGENTTVEFKRCGAQAGEDTFETICSFANHAGGNIFLGVEDDSTVSGISEPACQDIQRNIVNVVNNPNVFKPPVALEFETIDHDGKHVIRTWVPVDSSVHSFKDIIYDRVGDSDIRLRTDHQIASLYLRKQAAYTEQKIYPYVTLDDLDLTLLEDARQRASRKQPGHPWSEMSDEDLLRSANLYSKSYETGEEGFNLAAVLLLGKDPVIRSILPSYKTDALLRSKESDRYDDRLTVACNLLTAYPLLETFCKKHLNDRFYLENGQAVSPRDVIVRELVSNTLIHREYLSPFPARIVITDEEMTTENGSKAAFDGQLDLTAFNPMPKNPIIASFFNNIGWADELGSGSKNLLKYVRAYSGATPSLIEGSVFRAHIPLSSPDAHADIDSEVVDFVMGQVNRRGYVTTVDVRDGLDIEHKQAQRELGKFVEAGILKPIGKTRGRRYIPTSQ